MEHEEKHEEIEGMQNWTIHWKTPLHKHKERRTEWYVAVWIIAGAMILTGLFTNNIPFSIIILIAACMVTIFSNHAPRVVDITFDKRGLHFINHIYPYGYFQYFWITDEDEPRLLLKSHSVLASLISIPIDTKHIDIEQFRDFLSTYVKENFLREPLAVRLAEYAGF